MKTLEGIVCSLELAKTLCKLGVKQESLFYWVSLVDGKWFITSSGLDLYRIKERTEFYSAFTESELLEKLPDTINKKLIGGSSDLNASFYRLVIFKLDTKKWCVRYIDINNNAFVSFIHNTLARCAARMRIYLIKNKIIGVSK